MSNGFYLAPTCIYFQYKEKCIKFKYVSKSMSNFQAFSMSNYQAFSMSNFQAFSMSNFQAFSMSNFFSITFQGCHLFSSIFQACVDPFTYNYFCLTSLTLDYL